MMKMLGVIAVGSVALLTAACGGSGAANDGASPPTAGARVTVVPHGRLEALLPNLPGWQRGTPQGETDTTESVSRVTVDYEKPPSTLSFELMDSSMNEAVLALIKEAIAGKDNSLKPTTLAGFPGAEEWINERSRGSVHVLVGGRFMVVVTGEMVPDLAAIRGFAQAIDLQKMAALK